MDSPVGFLILICLAAVAANALWLVGVNHLIDAKIDAAIETHTHERQANERD
jgi:hypothetical protein